MQRKFSTYWISFLIIAIAGCSGVPVQSTSSQSTIKYGANAKASKLHIADIDDRETGVIIHAKEIAKELNQIPGRNIYLIDSSDILDITVFEEPDLSVKLKVAKDGTIAYPLIEAVGVKGLTTQEAEKKLEGLLLDGEYLKDPRVSIRLDIELMELSNEKEIFVMGEIKNAGPITILGKNITALEAVAKAGGFTEFAAPNRTSVIRIEDGVERTIMVDLNKVKDGYRFLDIILKAGDVVVIPESFF